MITEISHLLNKGKNLYSELITKYSNVLPPKIIDGANNTFKKGLPDKINNIITVLNSIEGNNKFNFVQDIDDAINLFSKNIEIQQSFNKCITYSGTKKFINGLGEEIEIKKIFENIKFGITYDVESLGILIAHGKLAL